MNKSLLQKLVGATNWTMLDYQRRDRGNHIEHRLTVTCDGRWWQFWKEPQRMVFAGHDTDWINETTGQRPSRSMAACLQRSVEILNTPTIPPPAKPAPGHPGDFQDWRDCPESKSEDRP